MPVQIKQSFKIKAPKSQVLTLINNLVELASILPYVVSVNVGEEGKSIWIVEGSMGFIKKKFTLNAEIKNISPEQLYFYAEGDGLSIKGTVNVIQRDSTNTILNVDVEVDEGTGIVGAIVNYVLSRSMPKDIEEIKEKLGQKLKTEVEILSG
jgi:carbon monoxide dehydrogenase subunit G